MAITNAFHEAVKQENVRKIRIMMSDSLLVDPSFAEFNQMEKLGAKVSGLYDPHDGKELISDQSLWNDEYMNKLMVQVVSNFSHERIDHLKAVVHYLRPVKATVHSVNNSVKNKRSESYSDYDIEKKRAIEENNYRPQKVAVGAILGGGVGAAIAAVAATPAVATVVGGAIVGAGIGAGIAIAVTNGDE